MGGWLRAVAWPSSRYAQCARAHAAGCQVLKKYVKKSPGAMEAKLDKLYSHTKSKQWSRCQPPACSLPAHLARRVWVPGVPYPECRTHTHTGYA